MSISTITRRVFMGGAGAAALVITAPTLVLAKDSATDLQRVLKDGQFFNAAELTVLADVTEIMIPRTDTPGAIDVHLMPVLDGMMLTWAGTNTKKVFRELVTQFNQVAEKTFKKSYDKLDYSRRLAIVEQVDQTAFDNKDTDLSKAYRHFKDISFYIFYTSEEMNEDYRMIPGGYRGCLDKSEKDAILARGFL